MKIALFSCDAHETNGWGSITLNICRSFSAKGIQFQLFLPRSHPVLTESWAEKVEYSLPTDALLYSPRAIAQALWCRPIDVSSCDVVHSLFSTPVALSAARAVSRHPELPFVLGEQGTYAVMPFQRPLSRWCYRKLLSHCDHFVTPSDFTRSLLINLVGDDRFEERTSVIPNGVESARFSGSERDKSATQSDRWGAPRKVFLGVGGLKPRKGFDISIAAIAPLLRERSDVVYRIVGGGSSDYLSVLKKLAAQEGVASQVEFAGELRGEALTREFLNAFAYLHLPQARHWQFEGFGIVYLEASAAGLPVVGSISGGVTSAVIHQETGLLSHEGDVLGARTHCKMLLDDRALYQRLASRGQEWARQHDWHEVTGKFLHLYERLMTKEQHN
jgi:glycosyltransferase involved in cell wall biosynthesis